MTERRTTHRRRSYLGATIAFNERRSTMDCLVRNFTEGGAKIDFPHGVLIPDRFDLTVPHRGLETRCRVVWRREAELGVVFCDEPEHRRPAEVIPLAYARRLALCEQDKARLRRRVDELST